MNNKTLNVLTEKNMNTHYAGLINAVKTNVNKLNLIVKCYLEYHVNIMVHEYKKNLWYHAIYNYTATISV